MAALQPSDVMKTARLAFTRERAAIESARCMVIGTARVGAIAGALDNLTAESAHVDAVEKALAGMLEELMLRRRGEWPRADEGRSDR